MDDYLIPLKQMKKKVILKRLFFDYTFKHIKIIIFFLCVSLCIQNKVFLKCLFFSLIFQIFPIRILNKTITPSRLLVLKIFKLFFVSLKLKL